MYSGLSRRLKPEMKYQPAADVKYSTLSNMKCASHMKYQSAGLQPGRSDVMICFAAFNGMQGKSGKLFPDFLFLGIDRRRMM